MDSDMKAAELADKLEQGGICRITPEEEALRNKCVRFAADMEVLLKHDPEFWTEYGVCTCEFSLVPSDPFSRLSMDGDSIYSAARAAVEDLEGGCDE